MLILLLRWLLRNMHSILTGELEREGALGLLSLIVMILLIVICYVYYGYRFGWW